METRQAPNERVRKLAETLRNNGLAASDTQAMEMAKEMAETDEKVMQQANRNKHSMIQNYDVNKPAVAVENPLEQEAPSPKEPSQQPREKEETAQDNPAPTQGPAPSTNQAVNDAINNVKEQFAQTIQENPELPQDLPVKEAVQEPVQAPAAEATIDVPEAPSFEPAPTPEQTQPPLNEQTTAPAAETPVQEPRPAGVVENPLPAETPTPTAPDQTTPTPEEPIPTPTKQADQYAESKVKLTDVFDVNK